MSDEEVSRNITESGDKIRVETKVKRGSGTRDQDDLKGNDLDNVVTKLNDTIGQIHETADKVRGLQPSEDDD